MAYLHVRLWQIYNRLVCNRHLCDRHLCDRHLCDRLGAQRRV